MSHTENQSHPVFTREMKKTHTILLPTMLPTHFAFMEQILKQYGYKCVLLDNGGRDVVNEGLRSVHNDTCYPALLVIGQMIDAIARHGVFRAPMPFEETCALAGDYINQGVKMGEGWLLTVEMAEHIHEGVNNIVCTQPFGCLPNHIAGKGMINEIKAKHPEANIVAIDYDPGASEVNQQNRIKMMLSNAKTAAAEKKERIEEYAH